MEQHYGGLNAEISLMANVDPGGTSSREITYESGDLELD